jgi:hemerythrin
VPLFAWSNDYAVGVKSLDIQHMKLFEMINDLEQAMKKGQAESVNAPLLRKLIAYTENHFAAEEKLMESAHYPDFEKHRALHVALARKVSDFMDRLERGGTAVNVDLLFFLCDWLKTHINQADKAYGPWLAAHGAQ